jgi:hypothetical protein
MHDTERPLSERTHAVDTRIAPDLPTMVSVTLTDKYGTYPIGLSRFTAGESVSVPVAEAERLISEGAAVRHDLPGTRSSTDGKSLAHPPKDKMIDHAATK